MSDQVSSAAFRAIVHARRSARRFQTGRIIPRAILTDILASTTRAPSGFNLQPTQIILVHSPALQQNLADHAMLGPGNQHRTRDASTLAVFLSDLEAGQRIARIQELETQARARHPNYLGQMPLISSFLLGQGQVATRIKNVATNLLAGYQPMPVVEPIHAWAYKNTGLALQSYVLAATSHGLGTCIMEGFDARRLKELLRVPDRYAVCACVATGYEYPDDDNNNNNEWDSQPSPRLPLEEVVFGDTFGQAWEFQDQGETKADMTEESQDDVKTA